METRNKKSCRIGRRADQQGSRPPVMDQAWIEKYATEPTQPEVTNGHRQRVNSSDGLSEQATQNLTKRRHKEDKNGPERNVRK